MKSYRYDVSVVVLTYNSNYEKLKNTLNSIIRQKNVALQIIVADDGSKINHFDKLREYFALNSFKDYILVENDENKGTVANKYSSLLHVSGKYVKDISPGDRLYNDNTLRNWIDYLEKNNLKWSFSEVIYYKLNGEEVQPVSVVAHPKNIKVFKKGSLKDMRWQYFVLNDIAVGSSMIGTSELHIRYCKEILNNVIYAEDNIWRMMMFDGVKGGYYPEYTVLYEYGCGISTSKNSEWSKRISMDWNSTDEIILNRKDLDKFQQKMINAILADKSGLIFKKLFIKGKLKHLLIKKRKSIDYLPYIENNTSVSLTK